MIFQWTPGVKRLNIYSIYNTFLSFMIEISVKQVTNCTSLFIENRIDLKIASPYWLFCLLLLLTKLSYWKRKFRTKMSLQLRYTAVVWFSRFTFIVFFLKFFRRKFLTIWTLDIVVSYLYYHNACDHQT